MTSFGDWIRRRRKSLDLTQAGLACQVGCAVVTIKKIERDERRPSRQMAERLADCLLIPAAERPAFIRAALSEVAPDRLSFPAVVTPTTRAFARLPQTLTPLIGRKKEISDGVRLLRHHTRLLTLTGPGGVGKTRLALAVAHEISAEFHDGAYFISLVSLQDHGYVAARIVQELGLKESSGQSIEETLIGYLSSRDLLLLLDNFEHLLPAAPLLAELLLAAPGLHLLVTSRSLLHLSSEIVLVIHPLALPQTPTSLNEEQAYRKVTRSDAVRLFVTRAKARNPAFRLAIENSRPVAEICRKLDGLPLAIELAAARANEYPLGVLQQELVKRMDLLVEGYRDLPARQQTLRHTLDWSFAHLEPVERELFPRLGVFAGGFTLEAALAVRGHYPRGELLAAIHGLVDKSLIVCKPEEERYTLLDTTREYALERLELSAQIEDTRQAHLAYFAQLAEEASPHLWDRQQSIWMHRLTLEIDNLRAALSWSLNRETSQFEEIDMGARLVASLWYFWYLIGSLAEGRSWLSLALKRASLSNQTRARVLLADSTFAWQQGDLPMANLRSREAISLYQMLEDEPGLAEATHIYGHIVFDQQYYPEAERIFRESLSMYENMGDAVIRVSLIGDLGLVACHQGDLKAAKARYEECLALAIHSEIKDSEAQTCLRLGDLARLEGDYRQAETLYKKGLALNRQLQVPLEIACSLHKLAYTMLRRSDVRYAHKLFLESLKLQHEFGNQQGIAECLAGLASVAVCLERYYEAARYYGAARRILTRTGLPLSPADLVEWRRDEAIARSTGNLEQFEKVWSHGASEPIEELIASLLVETPSTSS